jgi:hypothetical protein
MLVRAVLQSGDYYTVVVPPQEDGEHDLQILLWQLRWENPTEVPSLVCDGDVFFKGKRTNLFMEDTSWRTAFDAVSDFAMEYCDGRF